MKKQPFNQDTPADLKHDTMEFSAASEGDDRLDTDDETYEEEDITAEELDALDDEEDSEAAALNAENTDFAGDEDNMPEEDWTDDLPGEDYSEEDNEQHR